jgi:phage-related protein
MAGSLADVYVEVNVNTTTAGEAIEKQLPAHAEEAGKKASSSFSDSFTTGIRRLATTVGATLLGVKVADWFKETIEAGEDADRKLSQTEQVIRSTAGAAGLSAEEIANMSRNLSLQTGIDDTLIEHGANVALTFTRIKDAAGEGNDVFTQYLSTALDVSSALHEDVQSAVIQLGKALNDPITGMTTLRRVGVSFTQQQIDQAKALQNSGNLLGAQKLILKELQTEFGGAAKAGATTADLAKNRWAIFREELGQKLLPVVDKLIESFSEWLPGIIKAANHIADVVVAIGNFLANNKDLVKVLLTTVAALTLLSTAIDAVKAVHAAWLVITLEEDAALDANVIGVIIIAIAALVAGIIYAYQHFAAFRDIVNGTWDAIKVSTQAVIGFFTKDIPAAWSWLYEHTVQVFQHIRDDVLHYWDELKLGAELVVQWLKGVPGAIAGFFEALPGQLLNLAHQAGDALLFGIGYAIGLVIKEAMDMPHQVAALFHLMFMLAWNEVVTGWNFIVAQFEAFPSRAEHAVQVLWETVVRLFHSGVDQVKFIFTQLPVIIGNLFQQAVDTGLSRARALVDGIGNWLGQLPGRARSALIDLKNTVTGFMSSAGSWLVSAGHDLLFGLIHGVEGAIGDVIDAVKHAMGKVVDGAKKALGISSPSTVFADEVGRWIPPGIGKGVDEHLSEAVSPLAGLPAAAAPIVNVAPAPVNIIADLGNGVRQVIKAWVTENPQHVATATAAGQQRNSWAVGTA